MAQEMCQGLLGDRGGGYQAWRPELSDYAPLRAANSTYESNPAIAFYNAGHLLLTGEKFGLSPPCREGVTQPP